MPLAFIYVLNLRIVHCIFYLRTYSYAPIERKSFDRLTYLLLNLYSFYVLSP